MPNKSSKSPIEAFLIEALNSEENIDIAIQNNDEDKANQFALELETHVAAILSYSTTTLSDLKHKVSFIERLIKANHNDPELVSNIFAQILTDIDNLKLRHKDANSDT